MGWLFKPGYSRKDLIRERTEDWKRSGDDAVVVATTCLKHCYRGNVFSGVLWSVWERTFMQDDKESQPSQRWITCDLLRCQQGDWGYKDMDESMHPFYYSCPLGYLALVPIERYGGNEEWRAAVQSHHQGLRDKRRRTKVG